MYDDDPGIDACDFQDPGGRSALRRATRGNPRKYRCPKCGAPNRLTATDVALGYQCNACADWAEGGDSGI